jgi:hypothetical protein
MMAHKKRDFISKITRTKRARGLSSKLESLSSNPSATKKKTTKGNSATKVE